jgi:hypothetical protein
MTGCIEFERQTVYWRHNAAADTLLMVQDYQGIFGADGPVALNEDERTQLTSVMTSERTFFFSNWIMEYSRNTLLDLRQAGVGEIDPDPAYEAAARALVELALANVKVDNAGFYYNAKKELCGAQRVTVKNVSKVFEALNKLLLFVVREEGRKEDKSDEEKRVLLDYHRGGAAMVRLDGNRLEIRVPLTESDYRSFKNESRQGKAFAASGGTIAYEAGVMTMAIGGREEKISSVSMPFSEHTYRGNAVEAARAYGIKETFDAAAEAREFLGAD